MLDRRTLCLVLASLTLLACGEPTDPGPKSRRNDNPIERRMRELAPTPDRGDSEDVSQPRAAAPAPRERVEPETRIEEVVVTREPLADLETSTEEAAAPAAEVPAAEVPAAEVRASSSITLTRVVVARAIEDREPSGAAPIPADAERAYLFVEARNDGDAETSLDVEWIGPDGTVGEAIALRVPVASRWRTWATTSRVHGQPGSWRVVVREGGAEVHSARFDVGPASAPAS